jgi:hypothetical protein
METENLDGVIIYQQQRVIARYRRVLQEVANASNSDVTPAIKDKADAALMVQWDEPETSGEREDG